MVCKRRQSSEGRNTAAIILVQCRKIQTTERGVLSIAKQTFQKKKNMVEKSIFLLFTFQNEKNNLEKQIFIHIKREQNLQGDF